MKVDKNLVIGGVLVGGGLYYAYSKGWFKKKPATPTETAKQESQATIDTTKQEQKAVVKQQVKTAITTAAVKVVTTSLANPNSLDSKVKKLQLKAIKT
jgi:hypothetical protein